MRASILLIFLFYDVTEADEDTAAWEQFETIDEGELEQIKDDLKNYQTVGICGTTAILPNEWIYANKRRRRDAGNSTEERSTLSSRTEIGRIVGGQEANAHSWPWMVWLDFGRKSCGGTLIHPKYVITAVHCLHRESLPRLVIGAHHKRSSDNVIATAKRITLFPEFYKPVDYNNDIAIIELEKPVDITDTVRPLCLPAADSWIDPAVPGTTCVAAGWGATSAKKGEFPDLLQEVDIKLIPRTVCQKIPGYQNQVTDKMFCAGHLKGGKDSCQGDSGGPLMCKLIGLGNPWVLYGVTSWGSGCARAYSPGVYVKVSKFVDWIGNITGITSGIDVDNYYNLKEVEPESNFPTEVASTAADGVPNYFAQNMQSMADTWEVQHHIQDQKVCGGELWGPEGTIQSDGYPYRYQPRQYCKWIIQARNPKNIIVLKFKDIRLDSPYECFLNDHIMVFDYNNRIVGTPQCRLAKNTQWTVTGRRYLTVYFNSNDKTEGPGFEANYYEEEDPEKQHVEYMKAHRTCADRWKLMAMATQPQELTSPGWPNKYPLNTNCFWRIRAPSPMHYVQLQFKTVMLEDPAQNGKCKFDYVRIYKGTNDYDEKNMLGDLCGRPPEKDVEQTFYKGGVGESLFVSFNSDNMGVGKGFRAFYIATRSEEPLPKPTLSPTMQRYVLSNSGGTSTSLTTSSSSSEPSRPSGRPVKGGSGGYVNSSKKNKKKKKSKGKFARLRLWSLTRSQKMLYKTQDIGMDDQ